MKLIHVLLLIVFAVMIATNVFLAGKVGKLAYGVEQLNEAYRSAVESMKGLSEIIDSLPPLPPAEDDKLGD
jgi:hypothetical protein